MNRVVRGIFIGGILAAVVAGSGASLPFKKSERSSGVELGTGQSVEVVATPAKPVSTDNQHRGEQALTGRLAYLAHLDWRPSTMEIPSEFWTLLAGICLVLPFGLTTWATLKKRL